MPALNFQKQFAAAVESGEKRQTIRAFRKDGRNPKPGDTLYLYTGMRTKQCRKLGEVICSDARELWIARATTEFDCPYLLWLGRGEHQTMCSELMGQAEEMAKADGFSDWNEMVDWFDKTHGLPFEGLLIKWGEL